MSQCSTCRAAIRWVVMATGRRMRIDAEPHPEGNVRVLDDGRAEVLSGAVLDGLRRRGIIDGATELFRSHFATCPNAAAHRRRGK